MSDNEKRETHAAVIAEMRECEGYRAYYDGGKHHDSYEESVVGVDYLRDFADRLEAAHGRELARLREALKKAEAVIDGVRMMVLQGQEYDLDLVDFGGALAKCRDALAATETKGEKQ